MDWYAHSGSQPGKGDWQGLKSHLEGVAALAERKAQSFGLGRAAFVAGLFHDLGKYSPAFQQRLEGAAATVEHSTAGAQILKDMARGDNAAMAEIIGYAILGHHAGLPDRQGEGEGTFNLRMSAPLAIDDAWRREIPGELPDLVPQMMRSLPRDPVERAFAIAFMGRMIFSCLVDADFRDTEQFYASLGERQADRQWPALGGLLDEFAAGFDAHIAGFGAPSGELGQVRARVLAHVRHGAQREPGLFTLTVPTGGGKTLASLGFALDHARRYGHRRIIMAIPFTSIIEQTAQVLRDVLGAEHVLEHHSSIDEERLDGRREQRDKLKLAMEDWAAPVVVTTNVQLFESLFAARPSRARKLHNIANSILILDEAQTLPRHYLRPVMRVLDELARNYGCTIVLCTATQPALGKRAGFADGLALEGRELAPDPVGLAARLSRTRIRHGGEMDNEALVEALGRYEQALVIVNSRRHALDLFTQAQAAGLDGLVHLTTRQYAAHRRRILADVRTRLSGGQPCRLIATSLIEAGVDVDFPVGFRAEAGLDQIIQAAGRVNREGRRARDDSVVTVFHSADYEPPREIASLIGDMKRIIGKHDDLTAPAAIEDYFGEVYWRVGARGLDGKGILERFGLSPAGTDFRYRSVARDFRMIESGLEPVIVAIDEEAKASVRRLGVEDISTGRLARELQPYVVLAPPKARELLLRNGHVAFAEPQLRGDQFAVLMNDSLYRHDTGLIWENAEYLTLEGSVW
ncbi:CRISPR-associated helicase Cas3' [Aquamicrobium ahrensii]|uniref:CRISPR-associated endonuclease/helicase Cas3 n=1 Tax=Aquamicrobium ahrensii TaxID=469551 RepID=A0ABV2KJF4_9HYPH